jgi:hypothetical protein
MVMLFIAHSPTLADWGGDVGLSKRLFKVGLCPDRCIANQDDFAVYAQAQAFAGVQDWVLIGAEPTADGRSEQEVIEALEKRRQKPVDPRYYPKIKGEVGLFKVAEADVQRQIILARAMAGESENKKIRLKMADFADYLLKNAR